MKKKIIKKAEDYCEEQIEQDYESDEEDYDGELVDEMRKYPEDFK